MLRLFVLFCQHQPPPRLTVQYAHVALKTICYVKDVITRHTLLVAVCSLSVYNYVGVGGTDRREIFHDGTYRSRTYLLPFWLRYPPGPQIPNFGLNFGHLTVNNYLENGKSRRYMSIRAYRLPWYRRILSWLTPVSFNPDWGWALKWLTYYVVIIRIRIFILGRGRTPSSDRSPCGFRRYNCHNH